MSGEKKRCAYCDGELTGCACGWRKTTDGKLIHRNCKEMYEKEYIKKKENAK